MGTDGNICQYDAINNYTPVKYIRFSDPGLNVSAAMTSSNQWLAAVSRKTDSQINSIVVYKARVLDIHLRIETLLKDISW